MVEFAAGVATANLTPQDDDIIATVYKYIEIAAGIIKPKNVKS